MYEEFSEMDGEEAYYTLVPEQGLCLVGDDIINLRKVALIRKLDGKTLVYTDAPEPVILPVKSFEQIRDAVFAVDALDDDEDMEFDEDGEDED